MVTDSIQAVYLKGVTGCPGGLVQVPKMEKRMYKLARPGYKKCIVPKTAEKALQSLSSSDMRKMKVVGCSNLEQIMDVFLNIRNGDTIFFCSSFYHGL